MNDIIINECDLKNGTIYLDIFRPIFNKIKLNN